MFLVPAPRSEEMDKAHRDEHVQTVADRLVSHPSDGMFRLLVTALSSRYDKRSFRSLVLTAGIPNDAHEAAYELLEAADAIYDKVDPPESFCRGAILERVTEGLLTRRPDVERPDVDVQSEQRVGPFPDHWDDELSDPIDFVLPAQPEFYECKMHIKRIEPKHIEQFRIIRGIDPAALTAFVTTAKAATLVDWLEDRGDTTGPLHAFTYEDFLGLMDGRATRQVA